MKKLLSLFLLCIFLFVVSFVLTPKSFSDQVDDIQKQINDLTTSLNMSINATKPLESQINDIKQRITVIEQDITVKKKDIDDGYANLAKQQEILNATIRDYYIKSYYNSPLLILLSANSASDFTQILGYQKANADRDKAIITNIAITINDLKNEKIALENEETNISAIKSRLDVIVNGAKAYQTTLNNQIAQLSALQQQILAQRLAGLGIPLYAYSTSGGCSSDIGKDPGFGGGFGFFSYGVPNRVGLNQYGAFGRAKAGQSYEDILRAYYNFDSIDKKDATINVDGNGSYSLDDYVKRIYEVPNEWGDQGGMNALRAQAIAARSYALAYTNNGSGSICTTQQCQVFQSNPKGGNWDQAVNDTAGMVMMQGGQPIKAWFSSTHGGYEFSSSDVGWSATSWTKEARDTSGDVNSFSDLKNNAYDKDSPWFYCDWGSRSGNNNTAWLKSDEVADIVNVILLIQNDSSVKDHLYQTDKSNPAGTDTWDSGRVRQELSKYRTPYNNISDISVSADFGSGRTTSVNVSGDAGSTSISGSDFKNYFNLRAPANINIVGPLYNVERN